MTNQIKAIEKYFAVIQFIVMLLYKAVLAYESADEILKSQSGHSNGTC